MAVYIPIPVSEVKEEQETASKTYALSLETKKNVMITRENGEISEYGGRITGKTDNLQAVNQAIIKALISPRFKCLIYNNQYGSELKQMIIANNTTEDYIKENLPVFVRDALKPDTRILNVYDFSISQDNENVFVTFSADTIFGTTRIEVSI